MLLTIHHKEETLQMAASHHTVCIPAAWNHTEGHVYLEYAHAINPKQHSVLHLQVPAQHITLLLGMHHLQYGLWCTVVQSMRSVVCTETPWSAQLLQPSKYQQEASAP